MSTTTPAATATATAHSWLNPDEFGPLTSGDYLYKQKPNSHVLEESDRLVPWIVIIKTYIHYGLTIIFGHIHDFFDRIFNPEFKESMSEYDGYAPLATNFDSFYSRRLKARLGDCFSRPTEGVPGRIITVWDRESSTDHFFGKLTLTGEKIRCINLSSYNYLGFAQSVGQCADLAQVAIEQSGTIAGGTRFNAGTLDLHNTVESIVADFIGKEAALVFNMGYATNANFFASILDKDCLVISDELNHASIRTGLRLSGAVLKVFPHNNMEKLEEILRESISRGQPRRFKPWRKVIVAVEGLYSMEGTLCNLPALVELRNKYKFYLFVDEAHSIGAFGPNGRGVCDYFGVDPACVDILMGTFTKSFGANGGYVAASQELIQYLKLANINQIYGEAVAPPVLAQIQSSLLTIMGKVNPGEAQERLQRLAFNSRYLRLGLIKMGFTVTGHLDSPIIPLMLYVPSNMPYLSRTLLKRGIAIVVVGYPATPITSCRIRLCMSSALTKEDLDYVLQTFEEVGSHIRFSKHLSPDGKPYRQSWNEIKRTLVDIARDPGTSISPPL